MSEDRYTIEVSAGNQTVRVSAPTLAEALSLQEGVGNKPLTRGQVIASTILKKTPKTPERDQAFFGVEVKFGPYETTICCDDQQEQGKLFHTLFTIIRMLIDTNGTPP